MGIFASFLECIKFCCFFKNNTLGMRNDIFMRIVCWHAILFKYQTLFFRKLGKISENLSSAAVVICALRVKTQSEHNVHPDQLTL